MKEKLLWLFIILMTLPIWAPIITGALLALFGLLMIVFAVIPNEIYKILTGGLS